jgi:uncharacterized protein
MPDFIYLIHPLRDGFFDEPTSQEVTIMEEHYQHHKKATEDGVVLLAGPCLDKTFGIVIFHAENEDDANAFMFNDPAVKENVMMAEIHPIRISLVSSTAFSRNDGQ